MDEWLNQSVANGPGGSSVAVATLGVALFVMLGLYAALLLNADRLPRRLRLPLPAGLRSRLTIALVLVATLPAISLALVFSDRASRQRTERAALTLRTEAQGVARSLEFLLSQTTAGISALAQHVERTGALAPGTAVRQLQMHHDSAAGVYSMLAVRRDGTVVAATLRSRGRVNPFDVAALQLPDTPFLRLAMQSTVPEISGAALEPLLGQHSAILVSAPVHNADGSPWGTIIGAFDPSSVSSLVHWFAQDLAGGLIVTDARARLVLASPSAGFLPQQDLAGSAVLAPGRSAAEPFLFALDRPDGTREDLIGASALLRNGWLVVRFAPLTAMQAARRQEYGVAAGWLLASLVVSVCLAIALAGSISGPLRELDTAVRRFDPERDGADLPAPPAGAPREVMILFEHLVTLGQHLRSSYGQLHHSLRQGERLRAELMRVIETREQEIDNRTEDLREANATLDRLSRIDALTGVANRRGLAEFLDRAWRAALREQQPISVLMIDIDRFKPYNDTYGHQQGDTCIRAVADTIGQVVSRATDLVARYGGEEFVAVLGNTPLEGALEVAEQIRTSIERLAIPHAGVSEHGIVTVSIGVTSALPTRGSKPDASLAAADRALYAAKGQGRNRVGFSTAARTGLYQSLCLPNDPAQRPS